MWTVTQGDWEELKYALTAGPQELDWKIWFYVILLLREGGSELAENRLPMLYNGLADTVNPIAFLHNKLSQCIPM